MAHAFELGLVVAQPDDLIEAARLKASWRSSSADAFAATLAHNENAVLVTGDPEFKDETLVTTWFTANSTNVVAIVSRFTVNAGHESLPLRLMQGLLYGVEASDTAIYMMAGIVLEMTAPGINVP